MQKPVFPFNRQNYTLMLAGLGVVILGFILMSGGGSDDPEVFSEAIFSDRRLKLAPTLVLAGYGLVMYAIMKKPKTDDSVTKTDA